MIFGYTNLIISMSSSKTISIPSWVVGLVLATIVLFIFKVIGLPWFGHLSWWIVALPIWLPGLALFLVCKAIILLRDVIDAIDDMGYDDDDDDEIDDKPIMPTGPSHFNFDHLRKPIGKVESVTETDGGLTFTSKLY